MQVRCEYAWKSSPECWDVTGRCVRSAPGVATMTCGRDDNTVGPATAWRSGWAFHNSRNNRRRCGLKQPPESHDSVCRTRPDAYQRATVSTPTWCAAIQYPYPRVRMSRSTPSTMWRRYMSRCGPKLYVHISIRTGTVSIRGPIGTPCNKGGKSFRSGLLCRRWPSTYGST